MRNAGGHFGPGPKRSAYVSDPTDHEATLRSIELLGNEVAPRVRAEVAKRVAAAATATV